jgi:polyisoprenoid-binding protein YceI
MLPAVATKKPLTRSTTSTVIRLALILTLFLAPVLSRPAGADQAGLLPSSSQVTLRTYGLGLLPFDGQFTRFHGWIRYEPSKPATCQVILEIEANSLAMENKAIQQRITGPESMDVERFPTLAFQGDCQGDTVTGSLTLHGQTHPFVLDVERTQHNIVATGRLRRAEWGLTAHPLLGGSTIRIRVQIPNPFAGSRT